MEQIKRFCEGLNRVIWLYIVGLKLLDDNKDKQVKHDISDNHDEHNIVCHCIASYLVGTTSLSNHTVG